MGPIETSGARGRRNVAPVGFQQSLEVLTFEFDDLLLPRDLERNVDVDSRRWVFLRRSAGRYDHAECQTAFEVVAQLANVSRPGVARKSIDELWSEQARRERMLGSSESLDQVVNQQRQIFPTGA